MGVDLTEHSVIIGFAREGMLHWWKGSTSAKRFGFNHLHEGMELPMQSLVMQPRSGTFDVDSRDGIEYERGIWFPDTRTREMVVVSDRYDMSISPLIHDGATWDAGDDELLAPSLGNARLLSGAIRCRRQCSGHHLPQQSRRIRIARARGYVVSPWSEM